MTDVDQPMLQAIRASRARSRAWRLQGAWLTVALAVVALAFYLTYQFVEPAPPRAMTITTGSESGAYYQTALAYQRALAREGVTLHIETSPGSIENLRRLRDPDSDVDVAFVQGGTATERESDTLVGLASVYFEPVWLFTPDARPVNFLHALHGTRLDIGAEGSGTRAVALQLLAKNGVGLDDITPVTIDQPLETALAAGQLDGAFRVGSAEAPALQSLLRNPAVRTTPLRRAPAYARHFPFLEALTLYAGSLSFEGNLPRENIPLVAPAATLVARDSLHPALIQLLMHVVVSEHGQGSLLADSDTFPSTRWLDFPVQPDAERYLQNGPPFLQRYLPFWVANLLDRMKIMLVPLIALMIPMSRLLPPTYRWRMRRRIYQWYDEVQLIDTAAEDPARPWSFAQCHQAIDEIENEIRRVDVPLSFYHELYTLRQHIDLLRNQLRARAHSAPVTRPSD
ncbi:MAG: TAXI family TRAP transporter solute-binding subunit [Pseudomonadota bacterium]